jgi:hypothetical protein
MTMRADMAAAVKQSPNGRWRGTIDVTSAHWKELEGNASQEEKEEYLRVQAALGCDDKANCPYGTSASFSGNKKKITATCNVDPSAKTPQTRP